MPHYNPPGADEWGGAQKQVPGGGSVKKPRGRRAGTREQRDVGCVNEHVSHRDEATVTSVRVPLGISFLSGWRGPGGDC